MSHLNGYYSSLGLRDAQTERDSFLIANWVHTLSPKALFSFAPFYHLNQADYDSLPTDLPASTTWHQTSNYVGGQGDAHVDAGPNSFSAGFYSFYQTENDLFGVEVNTPPGASYPNTPATAAAALVEFYLTDHLRLGQYITLLGGERFSIYHGGYRRVRNLPPHRRNRRDSPPPLGPARLLRPLLPARALCSPSPVPSSTTPAACPPAKTAFTPLPSERDEEHQFGILIPYKGWSLDVDTFKNRVNNFLDHSNLGESNMYFPIAVDGALVRAWEMTLRSPELAHAGQFHLTYSNQIAQQRGNIIGGFVCQHSH